MYVENVKDLVLHRQRCPHRYHCRPRAASEFGQPRGVLNEGYNHKGWTSYDIVHMQDDLRRILVSVLQRVSGRRSAISNIHVHLQKLHATVIFLERVLCDSKA